MLVEVGVGMGDLLVGLLGGWMDSWLVRAVCWYV